MNNDQDNVYAVTAATGQLGVIAVEELISQVKPSQVVAIVRDAAKAEEIRARGVQVRVADYTDVETMKVALEGVDKLLFISSGDVNNRQLQHQNVIDAAKKAGIKRVAYTSILNAETTTNILAPDHKATESYIRESGLTYTFLRHGWYTENYNDIVQSAVDTGRLLTSTGKGRISSATRADYAAGDVAALMHDTENRVYELAGDTSWDFEELAGMIHALTGKDIIVQSVSKDEHIEALLALGLDPDTAYFVATLDSSIAKGELEHTGKELSMLAGRPTTSLLQYLTQQLAADRQ